ncbi:Crp/Fnr family transcriptional regulator [Catalinimonas niigatensis]|uniref:Crp/Fnr family transcriptional regulator n=1 Tax=Catalinimonas niigatensis TaxID=1397264 RepID=UPI0026650EE4|nr:Crp/Fnr family transcriptional regulator [Catalinimonas niigatensis]WPP49801.1 Crp/Fnr family transcriptional regulator [Catalinimonas niigatensis]
MLHRPDRIHSSFFQEGLSGPLKELDCQEHSRISLQIGREIYREGAPSLFVYHVLQGAVKTYQTNQSGQITIRDIHKVDSFFGYSTLFNKKLYAESAVCIEETELIKTPSHHFISLLHTSPPFASYFIQNLTHHLEEQIEFLLQQTFHSLRKKLAEQLLFQCEKQKTVQRFGQVILSSEWFSLYVGKHTITLDRILAEFEKEGIIYFKKKHFIILDLEKLESKMNEPFPDC